MKATIRLPELHSEKTGKGAYKAGKGKIPVQRYGDFYRSVTGKEKEKTEAEVWYQGHEPCMKGCV